MRDHLVERLPRVEPARIDAMLRERRIIGVDGPLGPGSPYVPDSFLWFQRDLPDEVPVPHDIGIVHRDENLVVVDKPHFMATIPRGQHIVETALVRLRCELGLPALSPAHRLDRVTAGLLMLVVRPEHRGAYQTMFRDRLVGKTYEAIAGHDPRLPLPHTVRSRIVKQRGVVCAREEPGPVNAETRIELVEHRGDLGRYRLTPRTGRTHQLRVHMAGLGLPILGDDFYPVLAARPLDDFRRPLQLLASTLEFTDPVTGQPRSFRTRLALQAWRSLAEWNAGVPGSAAPPPVCP
jgi:tRNA pseudouridine32 synthase/23S rRNA pseudouridine746 synthase